jgi:hypothetical protein
VPENPPLVPYHSLYISPLHIQQGIMSGDKMEVEKAEEKMATMEHSEQHYFKR